MTQEIVNSAMLRDVLKAVLRGKLIAFTADHKRVWMITYKNKLEKLKCLEEYKQIGNQSILKQTEEIRKKINEILSKEIEKKAVWCWQGGCVNDKNKW